MTIGIIGSGALGSNLARALARNGIEAIISNSRGASSLKELVKEIGPSITAGTVVEAASADIVVVAIRWVDVERVLSDLPPWGGRIVIDGTNPVLFLDPNSPDMSDPTNPLAAYGIKAVDFGEKNSTEILSQFVLGARVVRAFNHLEADLLAQPSIAGGRRVLFYSGDDVEAKVAVRDVIERMDFFPTDLGTLDVGASLAGLGGPLAIANFAAI